MTDRIKPIGKNRLSSKDILKRSSALTLLLSTVACSSNFFQSDLWNCIITPLLCFGGIVLVVGTIATIYEKNVETDGSASEKPNGPSYVGGGDPEHKQ